MQCAWNCQRVILGWFYNYGHFLARHPFFFLIFPLVVCGCLAVGFKYLDPIDDLEYLYAPMSSRAIDDREVVMNTFSNMSCYDYNPSSLYRNVVPEAQIIFRSKEYKTILKDEVLSELKNFYHAVLAISIVKDGWDITFEDVCRKRNGSCVISGGFVFDRSFKDMLKAGNVTYPVWRNDRDQPGVDMTSIFGNVDFNPSTKALISAGSFKITFPLQFGLKAKIWEAEFAKLARETKFTTVNVVYGISSSLDEELDKATKGDILYFALTFVLMITYASFVSSGGDCVSSRALLANAGVIAVLFGIVGAFGLVTLCGVNFANIVAMMPFLALGIGVDDMFLLMSSWSETLSETDLTIPERIGTVYRKAGIGITITSVTDFLAFVIGTTSAFRSVRNFCIYTGVAVILCYICNACVFGACLTFHARRVYSQRHVFTCQKVEKSREQLKKDGQTCCKTFWCGGKVPVKPGDDQSIFEKGPRKAFVRILLWNPVRYMILVFFAGYLAVSIWGCTKLRQGLELKNLAPKSSYYYEFQTWDNEDFGMKLPVSFVTIKTKNYMDNKTLQDVKELIETAQKDPLIFPELRFCWLIELALTQYYNTTSKHAFFTGLQEFLRQRPHFCNDIVFGQNKTIIASRCQVQSRKVIDSVQQAELMIHMREIADASPADVFAYHPSFVIFEQYTLILSNTLQTVGITIAVMFVATCIFLPHPLMVILVIAQVLMIVVGIFGFMAIWDLTLSSVTMIELIMSVGFSVDFCAHVCTAYMVSEEKTRMDRARDSIIHASSPIFNGGISSLIGVFLLLFTESYIFQSFFKIMLLVIGFGVLHAVFLVPVVLSFIGPNAYANLDGRISPSPSHTTDSAKQNGCTDASLNKENGTLNESKDGIELKSVVIKNGDNLVSTNQGFNDFDEVKDGNCGNNLTPVNVKADDKLEESNQTICDNGAVRNDTNNTIKSVNVKPGDKLVKSYQNCSDNSAVHDIRL